MGKVGDLPGTKVLNLETIVEFCKCFRKSFSYFYFLFRAPSRESHSVAEAESDGIDNALGTHRHLYSFAISDFNVRYRTCLSDFRQEDKSTKIYFL